MRDGDQETLRERTYRHLRREIIDGRRDAGSRLSAASISQDLQVSLSVVREALTVLSARGLAEAIPRRGFRVASLSVEQFRLLTDVRCDVEGLALRMSIEHGDIHWESRVVASFHELARSQEQPDWRTSDEWEQVHATFHRQLISACPVASLVDYCTTLRDTTAMYRSRSLARPSAALRDTLAEHTLLRDTALAHDSDAASSVLDAHYRRTLADLADQE